MVQEKPRISIICPAYNEESGIEENIGKLKEWINHLDRSVEVLIINDGSQDRTVERARQAIGGDPRFRLFSHLRNFGRGRALRTGFREARGDVIITTEADLSWGTDALERMLAVLDADPGVSAVFASTHLETGGYRNVPWHRQVISKLGNRILSRLCSGEVSMTTGMTRAYRAEVIRSHTFLQDGKEIHLEIAHRLLSLGCRVVEVPAVLTWPVESNKGNSRAKRTNWHKIVRLIATHLAFAVFQGISRVIAPVLGLLTVLMLGFGTMAVWNFLTGQTSIFLVMLVGIFSILWMNVALGFFLLFHTRQVEIATWKTQSLLCRYFNSTDHLVEDGSYYVAVAGARPDLPAERRPLAA